MAFFQLRGDFVSTAYFEILTTHPARNNGYITSELLHAYPHTRNILYTLRRYTLRNLEAKVIHKWQARRHITTRMLERLAIYTFTPVKPER